MSISLVSLAELKAFILEKTNTDSDTLLTNIITYISGSMQTYLNRNLEKMFRTEYFNTGIRLYYVSSPPIDTTTLTVTYDDTAQTINDDYYLWENEGKIEFYVTPSYIQPKQLKIEYYGGYQKNGNNVLEVPDDIKYACLLQCSFIYRRRKDIGTSSVNLPDSNIQTFGYGVELLPEVKNILNRYRIYN